MQTMAAIPVLEYASERIKEIKTFKDEIEVVLRGLEIREFLIQIV